LKRTIAMLAVGAILVGGTVPAAIFPTVDDQPILADAAASASGSDIAGASESPADDIQTFASPVTEPATPIVRDSFAVEKVQQQVVSTAAGTSGTLEIWPAIGPINDKFGYRGTEFHSGIDIMAPEASAVVAASPGTVESVSYGGGWGRHVIVDHGNGIKTLYAHMIDGSQAVVAGQQVAAGETLGSVGNTGYSTFPHLHFEVYVFGSRVDPMTWLP